MVRLPNYIKTTADVFVINIFMWKQYKLKSPLHSYRRKIPKASVAKTWKTSDGLFPLTQHPEVSLCKDPQGRTYWTPWSSLCVQLLLLSPHPVFSAPLLCAPANGPCNRCCLCCNAPSLQSPGGSSHSTSVRLGASQSTNPAIHPAPNSLC